MASSTSDRHTRIERRTIGGREARVRLDPDEIYIEWRPGRAAYIGVRIGDRIKDADRDVESVRIAEWRVTEITPEQVVGEDVRTGERREWDRESLERGLVVGTYATNLSGFELVTVHPVGSWDLSDEGAAGEAGYRGRPYVTVVAYGNNGEKYGRRYRYVEEGNTTDVELRDQDVRIDRLPDDLQRLLDEVVRTALADDGFAVHGPD